MNCSTIRRHPRLWIAKGVVIAMGMWQPTPAFGQHGGFDDARPAHALRSIAGTHGNTIAAAGLNIAPPTMTASVRLGSTDPGGRDLFGSVAVQGTVAVVGASAGDAAQGAAYVFEWKNGVWAQTAKLVAQSRSPLSEFGDSVKISGNSIAVSAPSEQNGSGAVYIFRKNGGAWRQEARLAAVDATDFSFFGDSIALAQDMAVVGAELGVTPGVGTTGAAYVFRRVGSAWVQEARLPNGNARLNGFFGTGTGIVDQDTVAIGAAQDQTGGVVTLYKRTAGLWAVQSQLTPGTTEDGQFFGLSIDISGNTMVVGAPFAAAASGARTGVAYVFRKGSGVAWAPVARLEPLEPEERLFAAQVAVSGSLLVVGAPFTDFTLPGVGGSAWLYQASGQSWGLTQKLKAPDATPFDDFGNYVAIDGTTVLIGAVNAPAPAGPQQGAAYVFSVNR